METHYDGGVVVVVVDWVFVVVVTSIRKGVGLSC